MKKIVFLMPVYNDWDSLSKLLNEINSVIQNITDYKFECIIVNDASLKKAPEIKKPQNIDYLKIIDMKKNRGHARCIAYGLRYISAKKDHDYAIILDSDGEDRPVEIESLINKLKRDPETSVVASRVKRSESNIFQILYKIHKFITLIFTGKKINFGNYCCLTIKDINLISNKGSLWCSFSGTIKKYISNLNEIYSNRGLRFYGPSKMSLFNLIVHSFSIIAVFKGIVFFRSAVIIIILSFFYNFFGSIFLILVQILVILFNLIIFVVSLRENESELIKSEENVLNENIITH